MGSRDIPKWLYDIEREKSGTTRLGWHSTKFDLESKDWDTIREEYVPELDCTFAQACNYLRKSWRLYKWGKKEGGNCWDRILTINRILKALGLELIEFHNGPSIEWIEHELVLEEVTGVPEQQSSEEVEEKYQQYSDYQQDLVDIELSPAEVRQLRAEERAAALADVGIDSW